MCLSGASHATRREDSQERKHYKIRGDGQSHDGLGLFSVMHGW